MEHCMVGGKSPERGCVLWDRQDWVYGHPIWLEVPTITLSESF